MSLFGYAVAAISAKLAPFDVGLKAQVDALKRPVEDLTRDRDAWRTCYEELARNPAELERQRAQFQVFQEQLMAQRNFCPADQLQLAYAQCTCTPTRQDALIGAYRSGSGRL